MHIKGSLKYEQIWKRRIELRTNHNDLRSELSVYLLGLAPGSPVQLAAKALADVAVAARPAIFAQSLSSRHWSLTALAFRSIDTDASGFAIIVAVTILAHLLAIHGQTSSLRRSCRKSFP